MNRTKALSLFFLCFTISLAGCGKNYPDPPKKITDDTCARIYLDMRPDLEKALGEAEGIPSELSTPQSAMFDFANPPDKEFEHLKKNGPQKYIKYVEGCRNLQKKELEQINKEFPVNLQNTGSKK